MSRYASHPETELELEKAGNLPPERRRVLFSHVEQCSACAAELWAHESQLRKDLEPRPADSDLDRAAVAGALLALRRRAPVAARFRRALPWVLAASLPLGALAAAMVWRTRHDAAELRSVQPSHAAPTSAPRASHAVSQADDSRGFAPELDRSASPLSVSAAAPVLQAPSAATEAPTAAKLFQRAAELKRAGETDRAIDVYRDLQRRFPGSPEAKLSSVVAGGLLLDRHRYAAAVEQFDRYLQSSGPASEEALVGRANALGGLGRRRDEAEAWSGLLLRFPGSVHARAAQSRLIQLGVASDPAKQP